MNQMRGGFDKVADEGYIALADDEGKVRRLSATQLGRLLAAADLILMRAGASSLAEAAAWGLPMLLVPYPHAQGHQKHNAMELVQRQAARMIEDAELTPGLLTEQVRELARQPERRQAMSAAATAWGSRGAAEQIAKLVIAAGASGR